LRTRFLRLAVAFAAGLLVTAGAPGVSHAQAPAAPQVPVVVPTAGGDVTVLADRLEEVGPERLLVATGNVEITRGNSRLIADRVEINRDTGDAVAQGRVVFYDGDNQLVGRRLEYNLKTGTGVVYQAEARTAPFYRISGERMDRLGESVYRIERGVFTTCEDDPPTWSFRFGSATADLNDFVYGSRASFWVKNVPLIPLVPFFAAAIRRERQTGFLFPKFGSSGDKGLYAELPFFWAINDSMDATIAPLVYQRRGEGFTGEYRYVLSTEQRGSVSAFLLQETQRNDASRGDASVKHDWTIGPGLSFKVDANAVTGDTVLREYGDRLQQRSAQRVESNIFLTKSWEAWNVVGNIFTYQDLTVRRPVELHRVPDLSLLGVRQPIPGLPGFLWEADAGYVNFVRDVGSDGQRLDLHPRISRPISPGGLFTITPFVGGRLTGYDTTVVGQRTTSAVTGPIEVTEKQGRLRRLAEAGSDFAMTFSRLYDPGGTWNIEGLLHTIEPRVNYTWITGSGQTRLPVWTEGVDRIQDTSRLEYSLTNRIRARTVTVADSEPVRWEALRVVLANSYDLEEREVGDVLGTLILQPVERLRFRGDVGYSPRGDGLQSATTDLAVRLAPVQFSIGTRYNDPGNFSFLTTGLSADLTRFLTLRFNNDYDLRTSTFVESRVATDFRFDCWALTLEFVHREGRDDEIRFALNLLGVGGPIRTSVGLGALEGSGEK
jgi:LPS-assembly protein